MGGPSVLARPSVGVVTNRFRPVPEGGKPAHLALDYGWGAGRVVRAAAAGRIQWDNSAGYGLRASIVHGWYIAKSTVTRYAHMATRVVGDGEWVEQGQFIGLMGDSGYFADGMHLHFELLLDYVKTDPSDWFFTPLPRPPKPTPDPEHLGDDCMFIMINDGQGRFGPVNGFYWHLTGAVWSPSTDRNMADRISVHQGAPFYNCTYEEWEFFKAVAPRAVPVVDSKALATDLAPLLGTSDVSSVLVKIDEVAAAINTKLDNQPTTFTVTAK